MIDGHYAADNRRHMPDFFWKLRKLLIGNGCVRSCEVDFSAAQRFDPGARSDRSITNFHRWKFFAEGGDPLLIKRCRESSTGAGQGILRAHEKRCEKQANTVSRSHGFEGCRCCSMIATSLCAICPARFRLMSSEPKRRGVARYDHTGSCARFFNSTERNPP